MGKLVFRWIFKVVVWEGLYFGGFGRAIDHNFFVHVGWSACRWVVMYVGRSRWVSV